MKQESRNNYENLNLDSSAANQTKKRVFTKGRIIALSIVIFFGVWDIFIDPPAWWRFERQQDKKAILAYVEEKYPNAKSKRSKFPFQRIVGPYPASIMYFELNGIEFAVTAEHGRLVWDGYPEARVCAQFDKIIQDGFFKPRGIHENAHYSFGDNYKEIYPYTGSLSIYIQVNDQGSTAREVGWLYDFYEFWKVEGAFLKDYRVDIDIYEDKKEKSHITYYNDSKFANEDEFYSAFKYV